MSDWGLRTVLVVLGTRTEAIKLAMLIRALRESMWCRVIVVVAAQDRDSVSQLLDLFDICPDHYLDLSRPAYSDSEIAQSALAQLDFILVTESPDAIVVPGETTTSMAAALASFHRSIRVIHMEAGNRTGDLKSRFSEETRRRVIACLSGLHLVTTSSETGNLTLQGIFPSAIEVTGNPAIDALRWTIERPAQLVAPELGSILARCGARRLILVIFDVLESQPTALRAVARALENLAQVNSDVHIVVSRPRNLATPDAMLSTLDGLANLDVVGPLDYSSFCVAMSRSYLVLTDCVRVQEEAPSLGVPADRNVHQASRTLGSLSAANTRATGALTGKSCRMSGISGYGGPSGPVQLR